MPWVPYRYNTEAESDGTELTMKGSKVPMGFVLEVTQISVVDISRGDQKLAVGYVDNTEAFREFCVNKGINLNIHQLYGEEFVYEGEAPAGRITTPEDGDDCYFSVSGKLWPTGLSLPAQSAAMGKLEKED